MSSPFPVHRYLSSALFTTTMHTPPAAATRRAFSTKGTTPRPTSTTFPLRRPAFSSSRSAIIGSARTISPSTSSCSPNSAAMNCTSSVVFD